MLPHSSVRLTAAFSLRMPRSVWALALLLGVGLCRPSQAQAPADVLILGTYHFDNPGLDVAQFQVADVLLPERQVEIEAVVQSLLAFRPTKVLVERLPERAARLDSLYDAYRAGQHTLARGEDEQLGFRIAAQSGLDRVYPVDHSGELPFSEFAAYAAQHESPAAARIGATIARVEAQMDSLQAGTIGETLRVLNTPASLRENLGVYLIGSSVGAGDGYAGAELASAWYDRNIRIFANVAALTEPGDRVLVIFGSGHAAILRHLVETSPEMRLVDPDLYF